MTDQDRIVLIVEDYDAEMACSEFVNLEALERYIQGCTDPEASTIAQQFLDRIQEGMKNSPVGSNVHKVGLQDMYRERRFYPGFPGDIFPEPPFVGNIVDRMIFCDE